MSKMIQTHYPLKVWNHLLYCVWSFSVVQIIFLWEVRESCGTWSCRSVVNCHPSYYRHWLTPIRRQFFTDLQPSQVDLPLINGGALTNQVKTIVNNPTEDNIPGSSHRSVRTEEMSLTRCKTSSRNYNQLPQTCPFSEIFFFFPSTMAFLT